MGSVLEFPVEGVGLMPLAVAFGHTVTSDTADGEAVAVAARLWGHGYRHGGQFDRPGVPGGVGEDIAAAGWARGMAAVSASASQAGLVDDRRVEVAVGVGMTTDDYRVVARRPSGCSTGRWLRMDLVGHRAVAPTCRARSPCAEAERSVAKAATARCRGIAARLALLTCRPAASWCSGPPVRAYRGPLTVDGECRGTCLMIVPRGLAGGGLQVARGELGLGTGGAADLAR
jgi:hypothetical protein